MVSKATFGWRWNRKDRKEMKKRRRIFRLFGNERKVERFLLELRHFPPLICQKLIFSFKREQVWKLDTIGITKLPPVIPLTLLGMSLTFSPFFCLFFSFSCNVFLLIYLFFILFLSNVLFVFSSQRFFGFF